MPKVATKEKPTELYLPVRPGVVLERTALFKYLIDLVIGMTGRTERYACLSVEARELVITLADDEYSAKHGELKHG